MRSIYGIGAAIAAIAASMMVGMEAMNLSKISEPADFSKSKRRKTGRSYPHSSARQRGRYARQIAAGQIKNAA